MTTYLNAYTLLEDLRESSGDYSTELVQGTDTSGSFTNAYLMRRINEAQRFLYSLLLPRIPSEFLKKVTASMVNSEYTVPWDFGVLKVLKNSNLNKVYRLAVDRLKISGQPGSDKLYYRKGRTIIIDKDSVSDDYELWFYRKCLELEQGKATAGAASSITLAASAKAIADYYNGVTLENITQDFVTEISDYSAARVATITGTAAANDYYGTVSNIPEDFHFLISPVANIMLKGMSPLSLDKPGSSEQRNIQDMISSALIAFAGSMEDGELEDIFVDFEPSTNIGGIFQ